MTEAEFCKNDSSFYGEEVDHINQIALRSLDGQELKEYVEHHIASQKLPSDEEVLEQMEKEYKKKAKCDLGEIERTAKRVGFLDCAKWMKSKYEPSN
jgi:glutamate synthase domain-containing protein 3